MAFPINSSVIAFDGLASLTVAGGTATVADGAFSVAGDVVAGNHLATIWI